LAPSHSTQIVLVHSADGNFIWLWWRSLWSSFA